MTDGEVKKDKSGGKRRAARKTGEVPKQFKDHLFTPDQDKELSRKNGAKGGHAKAETIKKRKSMAEAFEILLSMPMDPGASSSVDMSTNLKDAKASNPPVGEMIALAQIARALKGDTRAAEFIMSVMGDMNRATVSPLEGLADALKAYTEPKKKAEDDDGDSAPDE